MHDITDDAVLLISSFSLHYSTTANLSNGNKVTVFFLQGWLMEHNDQKSCTAILLLQIVKKKIEDEISHCKMYQLFSFSAVLTLKRL